MTEQEQTTVKTIKKDACLLCGSNGDHIYSNLQDVLFDAPLAWNMDGCSKCHLLWLNPSPSKESLEKLYTEYYTHNELSNEFLEKKDFSEFPLNKKIKYSILAYSNKYPIRNIPRKDFILGFFFGLIPGFKQKILIGTGGFPYHKNSKILDIGCGNGDYLLEMKYFGFDVFGTEIDSLAASTARKHGLNVLTGEIKEDTYKENTFDGIHMNNVIEHLPNPEEVLAICFKILKPGGTLVLKTCSSRSLAYTVFKENYRGLEVPRHIHIFSPYSLAKLGEKAGFRVNKITTTLNKYIWYSSYKIKQKQSEPAYPKENKLVSLLISLLVKTIITIRPHRGDDIFISFVK